MNKKFLFVLLLITTVLVTWCVFKKDNRNIAEFIDNYSWKLERCDKIQIKKLLVPNSYISREINNSWNVYTWTIPVGWNLVFCNWQEFSSASLNISLNSIISNDDEMILRLTWSDFLDIENYPSAKFTLRNLNKENGNYAVIWDLTIKGMKKTVKFDLNIWKIESEFNLSWEIYFDLSNRNISSDLIKNNLIKTSFNFMTRDMKN